MKKNLFIFFVLFTILAVIITLFPPVRPRGFIFLFSDALIRIDTSRLILEYVLAIFLSALGYLFYIKTSKKVKLFSLYIVVSIVSTFCFYLLLSPTLNLFSPSYNQVKDQEDYLNANFSDIISLSGYNPSEIGESLFLDISNQSPGTSYFIFVDLLLPDSLLPPIDKFLITSSQNDSIHKAEEQFRKSLKNPRTLLIPLYPGVKTFNELPYRYRKHYKIPDDLLIQERLLDYEIDILKYNFYKSYLTPFLDFYNLKNNYFESKKSFLSLKSILQKLFAILFFIITASVFYINRNKLLA